MEERRKDGGADLEFDILSDGTVVDGLRVDHHYLVIKCHDVIDLSTPIFRRMDVIVGIIYLQG